MYKSFFIGIVALLVTTLGFTQRRSYSYGSSIGISAGYADKGWGFMVDRNIHLDRWSYLEIAGFVSFGSYERFTNTDVPFSISTVQLGYYKQIWEEYNFRQFALNIGGGGALSFELMNNGNAIINLDETSKEYKSKLIFGPYIGIVGEYRFPNEDFLLIVRANEYFHLNSAYGKFYPYVGIGLKYFLTD